MYRLTCPFCGHVTESSFIRIGAVTQCAACKRRIEIDDHHVQRVVAVVPTENRDQDPLLTAAGVRETSTRYDDEGNQIGLSGLSHLMRREAGLPMVKRTADQPAIMTGQPHPAPRNHTSASRRRLNRRRTGRTKKSIVPWLAGMGFGMGLVAAALAITLYVNSQSPPDTSPNPPDEFDEMSVGNWYVASAQLILPGQWIVNEKTDEVIQPQPAPVRIISQSRITGSRGTALLARIASFQPGPIDSGTLGLALVDNRSRVLARAHWPVHLLHVGRTQVVRVPLSDQVAYRVASLVIESCHATYLQQAVALPDAKAFGSIETSRDETLLKMIVANTTQRTIGKIEALIVATDKDNRPIQRWRMSFTDTVEPGTRLRLAATSPGTPTIEPAGWYAIAVALPAIEQDQPEPAPPDDAAAGDDDSTATPADLDTFGTAPTDTDADESADANELRDWPMDDSTTTDPDADSEPNSTSDTTPDTGQGNLDDAIRDELGWPPQPETDTEVNPDATADGGPDHGADGVPDRVTDDQISGDAAGPVDDTTDTGPAAP